MSAENKEQSNSNPSNLAARFNSVAITAQRSLVVQASAVVSTVAANAKDNAARTHEVATGMTEHAKDAALHLKEDIKHAKEIIENTSDATANAILLRRNQLDAEIASFYLDGGKYGFPGSNGTWWSNYFRHVKNNHELISLFFADSKNPYDKKRRLLVLWCKYSLALFLSASIQAAVQASSDQDAKNFFNFAGTGWIVSIIIGPYGIILYEIAACSFLTRKNCCVIGFKWYGLFILTMLAIGSIGFIIGGALLANYVLDGGIFAATFFLAIAFDYLAYFYFGIWNWVFVSWEGFLCLPSLPNGTEKGCPGRFCPLLTHFPISFILGLYGMGGNTYLEDKKAFEEKFPGRITVDQLPVSTPTKASDKISNAV